MGFNWFDAGLREVDIMAIPLLISTVLLRSGVCLTLSQRSVGVGWVNGYILGYICTILLGIVFMCLQYCEYGEALFCLDGGFVANIFYILTFVHGMHVLVGVMVNILVFVFTVIYCVPVSHGLVEVRMWY